MDLKFFKLRKNRQRPDFCYGYEKKQNGFKYVIFTMNGGETFLASIERKNLRTWYTESSKTCDSIVDCLEFLDKHKNECVFV